MSPTGLSINWTTLARQEASAALEELSLLEAQAGLFADPGPTVHAAFALPLASELIARASALHGPGTVQGRFTPFLMAMQPAIDTLACDDPDQHPHLIDLLAFLNLARMHGENLREVPLPGLVDRYRAVVADIDASEAFLRLSAAFVGVAFRQSDLVPGLVDRRLPELVDGAGRFGVDMAGFLAHVAKAQIDAAPAVALVASFDDFAAHLPAMMAADEAHWPMLYSAAAGVFGEAAANTVHERIARLIAQGH